MSYNIFTLALKSTLDYEANLLAVSKGLPFIDLAAPSFDTSILESDRPAVCWEFSTIQEDPIDPLWLCSFDIGVMTMLDPSQYVSLDLVSMFLNAFKTGTRFVIKDYSGSLAPTQVLGYLHVISSGVVQQQADQSTGLRFVAVTARATRNT